jgi:membrane protein YdbS with pleckstrin-like domain
MAYPDDLLSRDEKVMLNKHPHWKTLILPSIWFVVAIGGGFWLAAVLRNWDQHQIAWIVIAIVVVLSLIFFTLVPFVRWRTEHFVITNHHVFFRRGLLRRREHQIPLRHIQNMETSVTFWGRLMGYGSLIVESGADAPLEFQNVASLSKVQALLNQLIAEDRDQDRNGPGNNQGYQGAGHQAPPAGYDPPAGYQQPPPTGYQPPPTGYQPPPANYQPPAG